MTSSFNENLGKHMCAEASIIKIYFNEHHATHILLTHT